MNSFRASRSNKLSSCKNRLYPKLKIRSQSFWINCRTTRYHWRHWSHMSLTCWCTWLRLSTNYMPNLWNLSRKLTLHKRKSLCRLRTLYSIKSTKNSRTASKLRTKKWLILKESKCKRLSWSSKTSTGCVPGVTKGKHLKKSWIFCVKIALRWSQSLSIKMLCIIPKQSV